MAYTKDVAVAATGDVYYVGSFGVNPHDFDPTDGVDYRVNNGWNDVFLTKLNPDGSYGWTGVIASTQPSRYDQAVFDDFALDGDLNVLAVGRADGAYDFDPGEGVDERVPILNGANPFVTKLDADGHYHGTRIIGQRASEYGTGVDARKIAIGPSGEAVVMGYFFERTDLDPGCGEQIHDGIRHSSDDYLLKLVCPVPTADANGDGFIELIDFAAIQRCFSGPAPTTCGDGCETLDLDADDDIDLHDYLLFKALQTP